MGRHAEGFVVQTFDGKTQIALPTLIECDMLPDDRSEMPSSEIARYHPHIKHVADEIPAVEPCAEILMLLSRDILRLHKVLEQRSGPHNVPFAQCLELGWVIIGEVCLGKTHKPADVSVFRTNVLSSGRSSILSQCTSGIYVKEKFNNTALHYNLQHDIATAVSERVPVYTPR